MKKVYLLDTNIVSEFSKEKPNQQVVDLYEKRKEICAISSITWQELSRGVERMSEGKRKSTIRGFLANFEQNIEDLRTTLRRNASDYGKSGEATSFLRQSDCRYCACKRNGSRNTQSFGFYGCTRYCFFARRRLVLETFREKSKKC